MTLKKEFYNPELETTELYSEVWKLEIVNIRGVEIIVNNHYWQDENGELWGNFDDPMENVRNTFDAYRKKLDYMTPDEIRDLRQKIGMSVRDFAKALGIAPSTLTEIENYKRLQVKYQENLFEAARGLYQNGQSLQLVKELNKPDIEKLIEKDLKQSNYNYSENLYQTSQPKQSNQVFKSTLGDAA
ncbi:helix-turn-helix domain-containing protein [Lactobacillus sp. LC28-10]|uniref:Helix-turn-helix domain-containing protein n=1 Tax=Secundilactobacillus angelensis TaxID=2722706 RepID=A0ABX1KWM0_9LACO|nr:helix-turn-helix domain-containing protein [Secundilactobacillus angelensis]MCH5463434.1 helix-turn-helix transcriptional regulator [Secundilactobacillus angelensis]NLR18327.1 helix-turn-helix domain-containing protein [Secundilactobacillus angelensis]